MVISAEKRQSMNGFVGCSGKQAFPMEEKDRVLVFTMFAMHSVFIRLLQWLSQGWISIIVFQFFLNILVISLWKQQINMSDLLRICTPSYFTISVAVSYTHLRAHETRHDLVCRLLL